MIRVDLPGMIL